MCKFRLAFIGMWNEGYICVQHLTSGDQWDALTIQLHGLRWWSRGYICAQLLTFS